VALLPDCGWSIFFFFFRGAVLIRCADYGGGFCFNSWEIRGGGGDVDAWGGLWNGGFFGFRACAVWGCFYQGFFERWGNVLWGMWQRCVAMLDWLTNRPECEHTLEQFLFRDV